MASKKNESSEIIVGAHLRNRRFDDLKRFQDYCHVPSEILVEETEISLDHGVKIQKNKLVTKKLSDKIDKDLKWYDFSIDSLSVVGALGNLKPQNLEGDVFSVADGISATLEGMEVPVEDNKNIEG